MSYQLRYRTFDQLLDDVRVDFPSLNLSGQIEPQQLIKVARRVNKDLGLRIQSTREEVIEVHKGRARLPEDFYMLNFGLIVGHHDITVIPPQGTHVEERQVPLYQCAPPEVIDTCKEPIVNPCSCHQSPCCCANKVPKKICQLNSCGESFELVQIIKTQRRVFKELHPLKIRMSSEIGLIMKDCPNYFWNTPNEAYMKDGFLMSDSFERATIYLNYQGDMVDKEGNVLVLDHEEINEYYEVSLKHRILENMYMDGEDVLQRLQYLEMKLKAARRMAVSIVNTPDFSELKKVFEVNRKAQYSRFYDMFRSHSPINQFYHYNHGKKM